MKEDINIVSYNDNCLNKQHIKDTLCHFYSLDFVFINKGPIDQYIGIYIKYNDDNSITMS